jgi:hypothetical protein
MKNIYILPTDKPSRLTIRLKTNELMYSYKEFVNQKYEDISLNQNQHIYITNDEEIKKGDKSLLFVEGFEPIILTHFEPIEEGYKGKKIILTTDQDLINDGVQAIDDEFLEWFVNNPSCESVEVIPLRKSSGWYDEKEVWHWDFLAYKIIIPQEEPKQETLEEVAENKFGKVNPTLGKSDYRIGYESGLIDGAKWQQEKSYSEEEVRTAIFTSFLLGVDRGFYSKEIEDKIIQKLKKK